MMQTRYLARMEAALGQLDEARRKEIVAEISGHLEDKAHQLMQCGFSEEVSMEKAMEALGDADELGRELKQVHGGFTKRDAWLAALPPVIFGLGTTITLLLMALMGGRLVIGGPTRVRFGSPDLNVFLAIGIGVALLVALTLVVGGLLAVVRRLPAWGYTWTGSAVLVVMSGLSVAAEDLPYLVSPVIDVVIMLVLLAMLAVAIGVAGWRGPLLGGLAGLSVTMILSLGIVCSVEAAPFSRLDIALLAGPLGLLYGGMLYSFVTGPPARRVALLTIGGLLCLGTMAGAYYGVFWQWVLEHGKNANILNLLIIGAALLAFGPAVGLIVQKLRLRAA
jgi:hypothetical protein